MKSIDGDDLLRRVNFLLATVYTPDFVEILTALKEYLEKAPTLTIDDLRPKGRWEWLGPYRYNNDGMIGTCSVCKERLRLFARNYCPNCGADMRGGGEKCLG